MTIEDLRRHDVPCQREHAPRATGFDPRPAYQVARTSLDLGLEHLQRRGCRAQIAFAIPR